MSVRDQQTLGLLCSQPPPHTAPCATAARRAGLEWAERGQHGGEAQLLLGLRFYLLHEASSLRRRERAIPVPPLAQTGSSSRNSVDPNGFPVIYTSWQLSVPPHDAKRSHHINHYSSQQLRSCFSSNLRGAVAEEEETALSPSSYFDPL